MLISLLWPKRQRVRTIVSSIPRLKVRYTHFCCSVSPFCYHKMCSNAAFFPLHPTLPPPDISVFVRVACPAEETETGSKSSKSESVTGSKSSKSDELGVGPILECETAQRTGCYQQVAICPTDEDSDDIPNSCNGLEAHGVVCEGDQSDDGMDSNSAEDNVCLNGQILDDSGDFCGSNEFYVNVPCPSSSSKSAKSESIGAWSKSAKSEWEGVGKSSKSAEIALPDIGKGSIEFCDDETQDACYEQIEEEFCPAEEPSPCNGLEFVGALCVAEDDECDDLSDYADNCQYYGYGKIGPDRKLTEEERKLEKWYGE